MADERKTQVTYQGNGTQRVYSFSFDYLRKAFVKVRLIDNETRKELIQGAEYTVTNKQITLASPTNLKIEIVRQTTTQPLVAWKDASVLKAVDMSVQEVQLLHLAEETWDNVQNGGMALSESLQAWDARMHRVINVLDPQEAQDVVTKQYYEKTSGRYQTMLQVTAEAYQRQLLAIQQNVLHAQSDINNNREQILQQAQQVMKDRNSVAQMQQAVTMSEQDVIAIKTKVENAIQHIKEQVKVWGASTTYSYPDVVAYVNGYTYRCIGNNIKGEHPDVSSNWICLTYFPEDFFEIDDEGDLIPALYPQHSLLFEIDGLGDIIPKKE